MFATFVLIAGPGMGGTIMKRIRIVHRTEYYYNQPVTFGPHRLMIRPREGHDIHLLQGRYVIEPKSTMR